MTPERWREAQRIFHDARERAPGERRAFVEEAAGGDAELAADVASLLAAGEKAEDFLESPAAPHDPPRTRVGPWRILREIGHGGMGTVYLGERADGPFEKTAAVKVVRRGMDTQAVLRRFLQERQILAGLEHPNVARLLDGGNTDDGLPYLVMEYVEGEPLGDSCAHRNLDLPARVVLFRTICATVQFAHQNLVVHRDLKPGNILVTADGTPKLLDFGVAKLLDADLAGGTLDPTVAGGGAFTPEYASPEQIRGERITTASDVWSLGVILYELLAGVRPFARPGASPHEIAKAVLDTEPERPSAASSRAGRGERHRRRLEGDLDAIVLKAMRKEPARRYASAERLSEDLRRWLDGLPVEARRGTLLYRTERFAARNKAGIAAAALVLLSLVGGIVATARQTRIARAERARADRRLEDVRKLASSFLFEFHDAIRNLPGSTPARSLIVRRALEYLGTLAKESGGDRVLQRDLAEAYEKLADVQGLSGGPSLGDSAGALASMKAAVQIREGLVASDPASVADRARLARTLGPFGSALATNGDAAGAVAASRRAVALLESAAADAPRDATLVRSLAEARFFLSNRLSSAGDNAGCIAEMRAALAAYEALLSAAPKDVRLRRAVALCNKYVASALIEDARPQKDLAAARDGYHRSREIEEALLAEDPTNALYKRDLSHSLAGLGEVLFKLGRPDEGATHYRRAIALRKELAAADPKNAGTRHALARAYLNLGHYEIAAGNPRSGIASLRESLPIFAELRAADPANEPLASDTALALATVGDGHAALRDCREAIRWYTRARDAFADLEASGRLAPGQRIFAIEAAQGLARCKGARGATGRR